MTKTQKASLAARYWNRAAYYTITENDIGKDTFWFHGSQNFADVIGRVLPQDVGKRIYEHNGVMQVENDEQYQSRIKFSRTSRVTLHLPCDVPLDTVCGLVFTVYGSHCHTSYGLQAKVVETTKPDDDPDVRLITIEISK